jgi:TonB family protein
MMLDLLAAVAVAASPQAATAGSATPTQVAPVTIAPPRPDEGAPVNARVDVPSDENTRGGIWSSVWPESAYRNHISGHVVLSCNVDAYGLAEACRVAYENPLKQGFGAAALQLRPTFKLKPAIGPDGPTDAIMRIAVEFKAPDPRIDFGMSREGGPVGERAGPTMPGSTQEYSDITQFGGTLVRRSVAMLNNPVWVSTIGYDDLMRAYPAKGGGVDGYAVAHCQVTRGGRLSGCQPIKEDPEGHGFGKAAVALASKFEVSREWATAPGHADLWVDVPIRFPAPGGAGARRVTSPYWVAGFDPDQALKLYPPEAIDKGVTTGRGIAKCVVTEDGQLSDCAPAEADPDGLGFSEAAAKLASTMRMNPWTVDGAPVDGAVIRVGVRLKLKSQQ